MKPKKEELLAKMGIIIVPDLVGPNDADVKLITKSTEGLGVTDLGAIVNVSRHDINKSAPKTTY